MKMMYQTGSIKEMMYDEDRHGTYDNPISER